MCVTLSQKKKAWVAWQSCWWSQTAARVDHASVMYTVWVALCRHWDPNGLGTSLHKYHPHCKQCKIIPWHDISWSTAGVLDTEQDSCDTKQWAPLQAMEFESTDHHKHFCNRYIKINVFKIFHLDLPALDSCYCNVSLHSCVWFHCAKLTVNIYNIKNIFLILPFSEEICLSTEVQWTIFDWQTQKNWKSNHSCSCLLWWSCKLSQQSALLI